MFYNKVELKLWGVAAERSEAAVLQEGATAGPDCGSRVMPGKYPGRPG